MDKSKEFESFLESFKGHGHDSLIDTVKAGFKVCLEAKEYDLKYAAMGNGITVFNKKEEEYGDYKKFAHINADRKIDFYEDLPLDVKDKIHKEAENEDPNISTTQDIKVFNKRPVAVTESIDATVLRDVKLKSGQVLPKGDKVTFDFIENGSLVEIKHPNLEKPIKTRTANAATILSKFTKQPSMKTLEKWVSDGICRSVTGHKVELDGYGPDGSPSWPMVVGII